MIQVVDFDRGPLIIGQQRTLVLAGDGPFDVSTSCFVGNPPPPGFRTCEECSTSRIVAGQVFRFSADAAFWRGKTGRIDIAIRDAVGATLTLFAQVVPDSEAAPRRQMAAG